MNADIAHVSRANSPGVLVVTGMLTQRSAFSTGGGSNDSFLDDAIFRDGLDRPTLRGTSLAGALLTSFRKCGFVDLPPTLTESAVDEAGRQYVGESVLRVWNSHPVDVWHLETPSGGGCDPRSGVGIRQDTNSAAPGALYDLEALPIGIQWPLVLELDLCRYASLKTTDTPWSEHQLEAALRVALREWEQGRCWLGRDVARGLGWMQLDKLQFQEKLGASAMTWASESLFIKSARRRTFSEFEIWAHRRPGDTEIRRCGASKAEENDLKSVRTGKPWHYVRINGLVTAGAREDGYGLDSLSLGGHDASLGRHKQISGDRLVKPLGVRSYQPSLDMSLAFSTIQRPGRDQTTEPFVSGSSIRGALRHSISRDRRSLGKIVLDPVTKLTYSGLGEESASADNTYPTDNTYPIQILFGEMPARRGEPHTGSSRLLVCDAFLVDASADIWKCAVMQMHAEDELAGGSFSSAKFDRLALLNGSFAWQIVIECPATEQHLAMQAAGEIIATLSKHDGHGLAIGGAQWRGHGWLLWSELQICCANAGDEQWKSCLDAPGLRTEEATNA